MTSAYEALLRAFLHYRQSAAARQRREQLRAEPPSRTYTFDRGGYLPKGLNRVERRAEDEQT